MPRGSPNQDQAPPPSVRTFGAAAAAVGAAGDCAYELETTTSASVASNAQVSPAVLGTALAICMWAPVSPMGSGVYGAPGVDGQDRHHTGAFATRTLRVGRSCAPAVPRGAKASIARRPPPA